MLVEAISFFNTVFIITDSLYPHYHSHSPWKEWTIRIHTIPTMRGLCTLAVVAQLEANIEALRAPDALLISTDGSVDQNTDCNREGTAFVPEDTSILHTEFYAIKMALKHAIVTIQSTIHIFSNSLSALQTLQGAQPADNLRLVTAVLFHIKQLEEQEKTLIL